MKTSVELDDAKVALAKKLGDATTLKELLDKSLDAFIAQARRHSMAEMLGTGFFDGDYSRMRPKHGRSRR